MNTINLAQTNSIVNTFVSQIRDTEIQKDSMRFRRNIERIGEVLAYELSKSLPFSDTEIQTPLGVSKIQLPSGAMVICSVLRAGIPLHNGILNYFDNSESAFISAYRNHKEGSEEFDIVVEYFAAPNLDDKILILADPMLATGQSLVAVLKALNKYGSPKKIIIVSVIASKEGVDFVEENFPQNTSLYTAAIDDTLNSKGYIVPGLGDAGDLAFGPKL